MVKMSPLRFETRDLYTDVEEVVALNLSTPAQRSEVRWRKTTGNGFLTVCVCVGWRRSVCLYLVFVSGGWKTSAFTHFCWSYWTPARRHGPHQELLINKTMKRFMVCLFYVLMYLHIRSFFLLKQSKWVQLSASFNQSTSNMFTLTSHSTSKTLVEKRGGSQRKLNVQVLRESLCFSSNITTNVLLPEKQSVTIITDTLQSKSSSFIWVERVLNVDPSSILLSHGDSGISQKWCQHAAVSV